MPDLAQVMNIRSLLNGTMLFLLLIIFIFSRTAVKSADSSTKWVTMSEDIVVTGSNQTVRLTLFDLTAISCARTCSTFDWCSSFVMYDAEGKCELLETQRLWLTLPSHGDKTYLYRELNSNKDWCPVDAGFVLSPAAQFCFLVVDNKIATWPESRAECVRRRLELAVPDTTLKMKVLLSFFTRRSANWVYAQDFFLGASRHVSDLFGYGTGSFEWITGATIDSRFLNPFWGVGQPNNVLSNQHCLTISETYRNLLNDYYCYQKGPFVCEKPSK